MFNFDTNVNNYFEPYSKLEMDELNYDELTSRLQIKIIEYTYKKIEKYNNENYQRTSKVIFSMNRKINVKLFCEEKLKNLDIDLKLKSYICQYLNYVPQWIKHKLNIDDYKQQKLEEKNGWYDLLNEMSYIERQFYKSNWDTNGIQLYNDNYWRIKNMYSTKEDFKKALNEYSHSDCDDRYDILLSMSDKDCLFLYQKWEKHGKIMYRLNYNLINKTYAKPQDFKNALYERIKHISTTNSDSKKIDGWINLDEALKFKNNDLKNKKGIYIIWNKTKNMYYVGQSVNLYVRLFHKHFSSFSHKVKKEEFIEDWLNKDQFYYRYIICETKDELNSLEKEYIEKYNCFWNGYNKTNGNK